MAWQARLVASGLGMAWIGVAGLARTGLFRWGKARCGAAGGARHGSARHGVDRLGLAGTASQVRVSHYMVWQAGRGRVRCVAA